MLKNEVSLRHWMVESIITDVTGRTIQTLNAVEGPNIWVVTKLEQRARQGSPFNVYVT